MKDFLSELKKRNGLLYWFGWYNLTFGIICIILMQFDTFQILGISRWIKPMKFFFSVWIMIWTMGWLLHYLQNKKSVIVVSWLITICMFVENFVIMLQSIRGQQSHFNVHSLLNAALFSIMGMFIFLFTLTTIYIAWLFFRQKEFSIPASYVWGIRLGLLFFIIFSVEGGIMLSNMGHTVGAADGSSGLPIVNWSRQYGDLRIAHFLGMHSLQILPLLGYYVFRKTQTMIMVSILYFFAVTTTLVIALMGLPLMKI